MLSTRTNASTRSVMSASEHFAQLPSADIPRSVFDRSHGYKTTFDEGKLIPFFMDEVLPGDSFDLSTTLFGRLATPIVPFMDNLYLDVQFFFVPSRLLWDHWQAFNGEQKRPGDTTDYLIPQMKSGKTGWSVGSVSDYMGLPTSVPNLSVSSLPLRAYSLIWNEWYRDENLQNPVEIDFGDTDATAEFSDMKPLPRGKRHDYFTSCLPWPQKGPGVEISLGNVYGSGVPLTFSNGLEFGHLYNSNYHGSRLALDNGVGSPKVGDTWNGTNFGDYNHDKYLSLATRKQLGDAPSGLQLEPITINDLRQAFQIQKLYERDARGGTRYVEILRAHFGVISPDSRLQRPEYLGGGSTRVNINPVAQTSSTDPNTSPQGNLSAYGVFASDGLGFQKSFVEHGYVLGLASVRADLTYQQGISRLWSRKSRFDFYWPALAHLGEQAVLNKEIFADGTENDESVFGYQERWAEYRYFPSKITGKLRSSDPQSLDVWHLSQYFDKCPKLNSEFIEEHPPIERVIAVNTEPHFLLDVWTELKCARPMPVYSVPGLVDHF